MGIHKTHDLKYDIKNTMRGTFRKHLKLNAYQLILIDIDI